MRTCPLRLFAGIAALVNSRHPQVGMEQTRHPYPRTLGEKLAFDIGKKRFNQLQQPTTHNYPHPNARPFGQSPDSHSISDLASNLVNRIALVGIDTSALICLSLGRIILVLSAILQLAMNAVRIACQFLGLVLSSPFSLAAAAIDRIGCSVCRVADRVLQIKISEQPLIGRRRGNARSVESGRNIDRPSRAIERPKVRGPEKYSESARPVVRADNTPPFEEIPEEEEEVPAETEEEAARRLARQQMIDRSRMAAYNKPRSQKSLKPYLLIEPSQGRAHEYKWNSMSEPQTVRIEAEEQLYEEATHVDSNTMPDDSTYQDILKSSPPSTNAWLPRTSNQRQASPTSTASPSLPNTVRRDAALRQGGSSASDTSPGSGTEASMNKWLPRRTR